MEICIFLVKNGNRLPTTKASHHYLRMAYRTLATKEIMHETLPTYMIRLNAVNRLFKWLERNVQNRTGVSGQAISLRYALTDFARK